MSEPFVGEVRIFGGNWAPSGWLFCNGQLLAISENDALFSLIGTTYGGDGQNTFAVPNLACRIPVGYGSLARTWNLGEQGGEETVTLTAAQLPAHTHAVRASDAAATSTTPAGNVWATWGDAPYATGSPNVTMSPGTVSATGSGQPHLNSVPSLGLSFIISLFGIYPSPS